jgi:BASS family bile acid:Na+ symporter
MDHPTLLYLVRITIFTLMLDIGLTIPFGQLTSLWRRPALLLRSLLAVLLLVPVVVLLLLWLLDLPRAVVTGLAVLAAAPGAPLTTMRSQMAGGSTPYSASLQLTLALLAVLTTPLTLALFHAMFVLETAGLPSLEVARQVAMVQFLPVSMGLLVRLLVPGLAGVATRPLTVLANVLFVLLIAAILVPSMRMILHFGALPALAVVIMVGISLAIGDLLGGSVPDERAALAVASIARNVGLALFITVLNRAEQAVLPTLVSYMILGGIVAVPYSGWSKRRVARRRDDQGDADGRAMTGGEARRVPPR